MAVPKFDTDYFQGITAPFIDWVAGGNFDGYLVQKKLIFREADHKVELHTLVVDKTRYDGNVEDALIIGTYKPSDKDTLTLTFDNFEMRGKIMGNKQEIIAFSVWSKTLNINEVYTAGSNGSATL